MRSATALVVVLLAAAHGYQEVHEIDTHTFDLKVREGVWLLMWYAPWCGHCKKMQPIFEEVAEYYHRRDDQVRVGRIDGTAHTGLASNAGVKGYPTLLLLRDGETIDEYKGPRTFEAITAFVDGTSNEPPSSTPQAPKTGGANDGKRRAKRDIVQRFFDNVVDRGAQLGRGLGELDSMQVGLLVLGTAVALAVGLMVLLCATTTASPRR